MRISDWSSDVCSSDLISLPVEQLAASATRLGQGEYDTPVAHVARGDEVGLLARTLEHARTSIRQQLLEIEEMGAARQKLESELSIASDIQQARSEEHTSELQSLMRISYAVFCLKKQNK